MRALLVSWLLSTTVFFTGCGGEPAESPSAPAPVEEPGERVPESVPEETASDEARHEAPVAAPVEPPVDLGRPTRDGAGGACATSDPLELGVAQAHTFVRAAAGPAGVLVAWQSPDGVRVRAIDGGGVPSGGVREVELDGPLIGLERVGRRFVAVSGTGALRVIDDAGLTIGAAFTLDGVRRGATISHGGEYREQGWRAIDVLAVENTIGLAHAYDGSAGGAVVLRTARLSEQDVFTSSPSAEIAMAGGALRGWESTDEGGLGIIAGGDEGEGPVRWLALPGRDAVRLRIVGGAIRRFALHEGGLRFLVAQRRGRFAMQGIEASGQAAGEPLSLPEDAALPEPWGADIYTRLWVQEGGADFIRRDAALRPIGEPVSMGAATHDGEGAIVWSGQAFLVVWADAASTVQLRAVVCQPPSVP